MKTLLVSYDLSFAGVRDVLRHPATGAEERLARAVLGLASILDGRTEPPTRTEIAAHNGWWLVFVEDGKGPPMPWTTRSPCHAPASTVRFLRFIPLDDNGRPTAWPVVEGGAP